MTFVDDTGRRHYYFHHSYNTTNDNERAIEVPLARQFIRSFTQRASGLEIGNVLSHYGQAPWMVLDRYEQADDVVNDDVLTWSPLRSFPWIVSISTFEHVGWDEPEDRDPSAAIHALRRMRSWLTPGGLAMVTIPLGHHKVLDEAILDGWSGAAASSFYARRPGNRWVLAEPHAAAYNYEIPTAMALWVGIFTHRGD